MEDVSGLSEESFLTASTAQKDEATKTEEVEGTGGKAKEPYTLVESNIPPKQPNPLPKKVFCDSVARNLTTIR